MTSIPAVTTTTDAGLTLAEVEPSPNTSHPIASTFEQARLHKLEHIDVVEVPCDMISPLTVVPTPPGTSTVTA